MCNNETDWNRSKEPVQEPHVMQLHLHLHLNILNRFPPLLEWFRFQLALSGRVFWLGGENMCNGERASIPTFLRTRMERPGNVSTMIPDDRERTY